MDAPYVALHFVLMYQKQNFNIMTMRAYMVPYFIIYCCEDYPMNKNNIDQSILKKYHSRRKNLMFF